MIEKLKISAIIKAFWAVLLVVSGVCIWVGKIQAKVEDIDSNDKVIFQKLDIIQKDTQYIKGVMDTMRDKKGD